MRGKPEKTTQGNICKQKETHEEKHKETKQPRFFLKVINENVRRNKRINI